MREKRFECVFVENKFGGTSRRLKDNETNITYMTCDVADLLNFQNTQIKILKDENEQLKKSEKINMEYTEQIVEENQKLRIAKNDLRIENEQLRKQVKSSETTSDATSNYNAHLESKITTLEKENEQLQKELQRFKKYVFSQDNILCYKCEHCIKKDIYVVDCEMKGEVDVHGLCSLFREVKV